MEGERGRVRVRLRDGMLHPTAVRPCPFLAGSKFSTSRSLDF